MRGADHVQGAGDLPRDAGRLRSELARVGDDQLRLARAVVGPPEHLVARLEVADAGADLGDDAGEVAALAAGEGRGPAVLHRAAADGRFAGVEAGGLYLDNDLALAGVRCVDVDDVEDIHVAVTVESNCLWHRKLLFRG